MSVTQCCICCTEFLLLNKLYINPVRVSNSEIAIWTLFCKYMNTIWYINLTQKNLLDKWATHNDVICDSAAFDTFNDNMICPCCQHQTIQSNLDPLAAEILAYRKTFKDKYGSGNNCYDERKWLPVTLNCIHSHGQDAVNGSFSGGHYYAVSPSNSAKKSDAFMKFDPRFNSVFWVNNDEYTGRSVTRRYNVPPDMISFQGNMYQKDRYLCLYTNEYFDLLSSTLKFLKQLCPDIMLSDLISDKIALCDDCARHLTYDYTVFKQNLNYPDKLVTLTSVIMSNSHRTLWITNNGNKCKCMVYYQRDTDSDYLYEKISILKGNSIHDINIPKGATAIKLMSNNQQLDIVMVG